MSFQTTITLGNILEIFTIALGGITFLWEMRNRLSLLQNNHDVISHKVEKIDAELSALRELATQLVAHNVRMNAMEQRMLDLNERIIELNERWTELMGVTPKRRLRVPRVSV